MLHFYTIKGGGKKRKKAPIESILPQKCGKNCYLGQSRRQNIIKLLLQMVSGTNILWRPTVELWAKPLFLKFKWKFSTLWTIGFLAFLQLEPDLSPLFPFSGYCEFLHLSQNIHMKYANEESLGFFDLADAWASEPILKQRERIKLKTMETRRLQHRKYAA